MISESEKQFLDFAMNLPIEEEEVEPEEDTGENVPNGNIHERADLFVYNM